MPRFTLIAFLLALPACFDSDDLAVHYSCENPPDDSDDHGRCYVYREGWAAWAQTLTYGEMSELEALGVIVPSTRGFAADCWDLALGDATGATLCIVPLDGVDVAAVPLVDMPTALRDSECAGVDPWAETLNLGPDCFARVGDFATLLDVDRPLP